MAESYLPPNPGPYPQDKPPENKVRFTPVQVCIPYTSTVLIDSLTEALQQHATQPQDSSCIYGIAVCSGSFGQVQQILYRLCLKTF